MQAFYDWYIQAKHGDRKNYPAGWYGEYIEYTRPKNHEAIHEAYKAQWDKPENERDYSKLPKPIYKTQLAEKLVGLFFGMRYEGNEIVTKLDVVRHFPTVN